MPLFPSAGLSTWCTLYMYMLSVWGASGIILSLLCESPYPTFTLLCLSTFFLKQGDWQFPRGNQSLIVFILWPLWYVLLETGLGHARCAWNRKWWAFRVGGRNSFHHLRPSSEELWCSVVMTLPLGWTVLLDLCRGEIKHGLSSTLCFRQTFSCPKAVEYLEEDRFWPWSQHGEQMIVHL